MAVDEKQVKQYWACDTCGGVLALPYGIEPECCGRVMRDGRIAFPGGDIDELRLHVLALRHPAEKDWSATPEHQLELWQLKPGRRDGERVGWIAVYATSCEWIMVPGVTIDRGFAPTVAQAAEAMMTAIQGGIGAREMVAEIVS